MNTKKFFIIFISIGCIGLSFSNAQIMIGGVASGNLSMISFDDSNSNLNALPSPGFDAGLMAYIRVKKKYGLSMQLTYSQRNRHVVGIENSRTSDPLYDLRSSMHCIEVPVLYLLESKKIIDKEKKSGGGSKVFDWFVGAGPLFSYWLYNTGSFKSSFLIEQKINTVDYTTVFYKSKFSRDEINDTHKQIIENPNRFQFGLSLTGGIIFQPSPRQKIITSVHLNFIQTFLSANSDGVFSATAIDVDKLRVKNHNLRISISYIFDTQYEKSKRGKSTKKVKTGKKKRK